MFYTCIDIFSQPEEKKEKDKHENTTKADKISEPSTRSQKRDEPVKSAWHKDDKKDKDEAKLAALSSDPGADKKDRDKGRFFEKYSSKNLIS